MLLVEDFADARELYATCLRMSGYDVVEAGDGSEALDLARSTAPDLILMDMSLPGLNGWEATAELKRDQRTRHVLDDERDRIVGLGCERFLAKPCLPPDLIRTVSEVLQSRQVRPQPA